MTHPLNSPGTASPPPRAAQRIGPAVVIGTTLEWFDFYLYASMAALVFGRIFFPSEDSSLSTLAAFATFAVGFLARPLGGILFGVLGDRIGRKAVLSLSLLIMGLASGLIGLLPSYAAIGVAAPVLLVILRILQGFGASAELGSAIAVAYEHADDRTRGRYAALPALGAQIGLLAASLTVTAVTSFGDDFLYTWGWRIPFVASFAIVGVGLWIRRTMPETPEFERVAVDARERKTLHVLRDLMKSDWRGLAVVAAVYGGYAAISYTFKTFSLSYLTEFQGVAANVGSFGVTLASAVAIVTVPVIGRLCDRIDVRRAIIGGACGVLLLAFPMFWVLDTGRPVYIWALLMLTTGVLAPVIIVAASPFMARQFPTEVRASGLGTGREISGATAGGLAPMAALAMVTMSSSHATWGVSLLIVASALLVVLGACFDQQHRVRARTRPLSDAPEAAGSTRGSDHRATAD
ncbi:MFS transporter [Streptomyces viridiviolaceus]|uniref:MFS transporter n=1 Tax=Streptomyces viridiviolaceus TaxID=68282 RepID=A0ABW2EA90_9ACTN|nr:MFS transporter [Streptomyces viridiviolaceus]GHB73861.1 MFS transporter [Streptomyces viridiviolaceus]